MMLRLASPLLAVTLAVAALELVEPTLDDVFVEQTGRHLEGDESGGSAAAAEPAEPSEPVEAP